MLTLTEAMTMFETANTARNLKPKTLRFYRQQLGAFVAWLTGQGVTTVGEVTPALIRSYLVGVQGRGVTPATVHAAARSIRAWLNWLEGEGVLQVNPARKVKMPKLPKHILAACSPADTEALLRAAAETANPERDRAVILVLVDTGLRASELCGLQWADVDLQRRVLVVRDGKGGKDRLAYIGKRCADALAEWRAVAGGSGSVFGLRYDGLKALLRRLSAAAGVKVSAHALRRSFAVSLLRSGVDLLRVARLLGHSEGSGLQVVQQYLPLAEDDLERAHRAASPGDRLGEG